MISLARQSARLSRRTGRQRWLNGDTAVAFVIARSCLGAGFGNCRVTHSSDLQTLLTRQGPDLFANPPNRRMAGCITAELSIYVFAPQIRALSSNRKHIWRTLGCIMPDRSYRSNGDEY